MKIYFNRRPVDGPWGGGSKVLRAIVEESIARGHFVCFEEELYDHHDIDVVVCVDPRPARVTCLDLINYVSFRNTKLIQRVGNIGTHGKPDLFKLVCETTKFSDVVVFPSSWARDQVSPKTRSIVIENAPRDEFVEAFEFSNTKRDYEGRVRIVTHHWSDNPMKGFDVYREFDDYCSQSYKFEFVYMGRKPSGVEFRNYVPPQDVSGIIKALSKSHVYLTASRKEAGANHVLEALAMGLPVLYHEDGGSINEYCRDFGVSFSSYEVLTVTLEDKFEELVKIAKRMSYNKKLSNSAREYVDLFEEIVR